MHKAILNVELIIIVLEGKAATTTNFKPVVYNLPLGVPVFVIVGCPVSIHFLLVQSKTPVIADII